MKSWKPGQSGNPSGLTSAEVRARRTIRKLACASTEDAMNTLSDLMKSSPSDMVRFLAAKEIKDTAGGKPKVRDLTAEEMDRLVDKRIGELLAKAVEAKRAGSIDVDVEEK